MYPDLKVGTFLKQVENLGTDANTGVGYFALTDGVREYYMEYGPYIRLVFVAA